MESEDVLKKADKIVIIDHHRRSADYIENATLTFQEVYASSSAELVTELLRYAEVNVELKKIEAEALEEEKELAKISPEQRALRAEKLFKINHSLYFYENQ